MKNNKKFAGDSGYLFYNVTTIDPSIHTSDKVCKEEMKTEEYENWRIWKLKNMKTEEYENCRSFRVVKRQQ